MSSPLTTLFVLPAGNTLPTTGSTDALTPGKFGVYRNDYSVATTGNIAAAPYIYLAQGRIENVPGLGSKRSEKLYKANVIEWYKVPAITTSQVQISAIGNSGGASTDDIVGPKCDEQWSLTLRLFSSYIDLAYFNGLTRSFTYVTECCDDCGTGDCGTANIPNLVAFFVNAINTDPVISQYVTAAAVSNGGLNGITITGKALNKYAQPCDITAFPYEYDKLRFQTWFYQGAATSQDYLIYDICEQIPVTVVQTSTYPTGSGSEIQLLELRTYSYQTTYKHVFKYAVYNGAYTSYVNTALNYDTYYIKVKDPDKQTWGDYILEDETVIIAVPTGETATLETLLVTFFGPVTVIN